MCPGMLYVPGGIHTVPPDPAALIAALKAFVESPAPEASAPSLVSRASRLRERGADLLEVGEVDRVRRGGVFGVNLELKCRTHRIGCGEQAVHLIVEMVRVAAARRVGERVAAVVPAVGVGQGEVALFGAVDVERERSCVDRPVRGVGDAVPEVDRVGGYRGRERDRLAAAQRHSLAARRLVGQLALGVARADDRPGRRRVLGLDLDVRQARSVAAGRGGPRRRSRHGQ